MFHGVSSQQLTELVAKTPFHFLKFSHGESVIREGDDCTHIRFVVSGSVTLSLRFHNLHISLAQTVSAPNVLAPDRLFGLDTTYPFTVTAQGECGILQLRKADYVAMLQDNKIFLFNMLNNLSTGSQRILSSAVSWHRRTLADRLMWLVSMLTIPQSSDVTLRFRQNDLCALLATHRGTLAKTLTAMQNAGAIRYTAGEIVFCQQDMEKEPTIIC